MLLFCYKFHYKVQKADNRICIRSSLILERQAPCGLPRLSPNQITHRLVVHFTVCPSGEMNFRKFSRTLLR